MQARSCTDGCVDGAASWRRGCRLRFLMLVLLSTAGLSMAQPCPDSRASLLQVRNTINDLGKNDRAPSGADCAYQWASSESLESKPLDTLQIGFWSDAADIQRRAAEKRYAAKRVQDGDDYLDREITLRRRFLQIALKQDLNSTGRDELRRAVVRHLSALAGALARRQQYLEVDKVLANTDASVIDEEAVNVWLQAVWSCAKFDGQKRNLCTQENREQCKEKIEAFLASVGDMRSRRFPPQTRRDIESLKSLSSKGGCLQ